MSFENIEINNKILSDNVFVRFNFLWTFNENSDGLKVCLYL